MYAKEKISIKLKKTLISLCVNLNNVFRCCFSSPRTCILNFGSLQIMREACKEIFCQFEFTLKRRITRHIIILLNKFYHYYNLSRVFQIWNKEGKQMVPQYEQVNGVFQLVNRHPQLMTLDCLCPSCYISLESKYGKPPPSKKEKVGHL